MAFIPKDAKWYLAGLLVKFTVEGDPRSVLHTNQVLIRADSPEEAYQRSIKLGKVHNFAYENLAHKKVRCGFIGLRDLNVIHNELEHGAEIMFDEDMGLSDEQIRRRVSPKRHLGVFQPIQPGERRGCPDYAPGDIMREAYKDLEKQEQRQKKKKSLTRPAGNRSRRSPSRQKKYR